jgi:hypothetical protein
MPIPLALSLFDNVYKIRFQMPNSTSTMSAIEGVKPMAQFAFYFSEVSGSLSI